jgi:hypothetical protein
MVVWKFSLLLFFPHSFPRYITAKRDYAPTVRIHTRANIDVSLQKYSHSVDCTIITNYAVAHEQQLAQGIARLLQLQLAAACSHVTH